MPITAFRNRFVIYGEGLLTASASPKLEDHTSSFVRGCLFNTFAATLHNWRSSLHPQPEEAPCCGDKEPYPTWRRYLQILMCQPEQGELII
jgi:hypothetical protein